MLVHVLCHDISMLVHVLCHDISMLVHVLCHAVCVADAPESSLRNVGVCPFNIDALTDPREYAGECDKGVHYIK